MIKEIQTNIEIHYSEVVEKFKVKNNFDGKILFLDKNGPSVEYSITKDENKIFDIKYILGKNKRIKNIDFIKFISPKEINTVKIETLS